MVISTELAKFNDYLANQSPEVDYLFLESPKIPEEATEADYQGILSGTRHLVLGKKMSEQVKKLVSKIERLQQNWSGGNTGMNNAIWNEYLIPLTKKALRAKPASSFQNLLGLLIFMINDDGDWLNDQEIYMSEEAFAGFFYSFSNSWKRVLAASDSELGLPDGARELLINELTAIQKSVNKMIEETFDEMVETENIRLLMVE